MAEEGKKVIAIDIGGTKVASALVTLGDGQTPRVEGYGRRPTEAQLGGRHVLEVALGSARRVIELAGGSVDGVGVSTGGVVDPRTGDITYANDMMPGWGGTHLGSELERAFGVPARVMNDVHAHAFGEASWGAGLGSDSAFVCAVGTGIGGAFVEHGRLLLGAHGAAANIGHVTCTDAAGIPCQCGGVGHVETIACGPGILARYLELGGVATRPDGRPTDGADISRLAETGDEAAIAAESRSGHALGEVLGSMVNMFDPDCVILSGSVAKCGPVWHDALGRGWAEVVMPPQANTPVMSGTLGDAAPLIGAAQNVVSSAYVSLD
ncbi:ROK family protein [Olsenella uli]